MRLDTQIRSLSRTGASHRDLRRSVRRALDRVITRIEDIAGWVAGAHPPWLGTGPRRGLLVRRTDGRTVVLPVPLMRLHHGVERGLPIHHLGDARRRRRGRRTRAPTRAPRR